MIFAEVYVFWKFGVPDTPDYVYNIFSNRLRRENQPFLEIYMQSN